MIAALETLGAPIRNKQHASFTCATGSFSELFSDEQVQRWLTDPTYSDLSGNRTDEPNIRLRYKDRAEHIKRHRAFKEMTTFLRKYLAIAILCPKRTERDYWGLSCLSQPDILARVNIFWQEVLTISETGDQIQCSFHLSKSLFPLVLSSLKSGEYKIGEHRYVTGGAGSTQPDCLRSSQCNTRLG
jgi:hypothetical protein